MRTRAMWLMVAALLIALAAPALHADTRIMAGTTGIVQLPTAEIVPLLDYDLSATFVRAEDSLLTYRGYPVCLAVGIADRFELGVAVGRLAASDDTDDSYFNVGLKAIAVPESRGGPQIAVGADFYRNNLAVGGTDKLTSLYVVAGKQLFGPGEFDKPGTSLRGTVGLAWDRWDSTTLGTEDFISPFVGLEIGSPIGLSVAAEYAMDEDAFRDSILSVVARYAISDSWAVRVGTTNFKADNQGTFVGIHYRFAGRR